MSRITIRKNSAELEEAHVSDSRFRGDSVEATYELDCGEPFLVVGGVVVTPAQARKFANKVLDLADRFDVAKGARRWT